MTKKKKQSLITKRDVETVTLSPYAFTLNETILNIDPATNDSTFHYTSKTTDLSGNKKPTPAFKISFNNRTGKWECNNPIFSEGAINEWVDALRKKFEPSTENVEYFK